MHINLNVSLHLTTMDTYEVVYSKTWINWILVVLYLCGIISCVGVGVVIWFEKSGQAGPYRTLVNQLISLRLQLYLAGYGLSSIFYLRILVGPLSWFFCDFTRFFLHLIGMNVFLLTLANNLHRFIIVVLYKSIPVMNDQLLYKITVRTICLWSWLILGIKEFLQSHTQITAMCTGNKIEMELKNDFFVPSLVLVGGITMVLGIFLNLATALKKPRDMVVPFNHQNGTVTTLDSSILTCLTTCFIFIAAVAVAMIT